MSERDPQRWSRFALSLLTLLAVGVAAPIGLIAAARSRFGSANPMSGADPPWRWGSDEVGDALSGPIADDTVIDGIIRLSLCVVWVALAVIVMTTLAEVVHAVRHHGLGLPEIRGVGWAQRVARFIAVGLVAVLPLMTSSTSLASTLDARAVATASTGPADSLAGPHIGRPPATSDDDGTVGDADDADRHRPTRRSGRIHVVAAGESIYSIAVDLAAGDSSRILDIADELIDANVGAVMPGGQRFTNPAYIEVGWTLQIPAEIADPRALRRRCAGRRSPIAATYTVEQGDTLWDIADEQLGDPAAWPEIWERNAGDDMGGGRTFDDPDLILPGWELELGRRRPSTAPDVTDPGVGGSGRFGGRAEHDAEPPTAGDVPTPRRHPTGATVDTTRADIDVDGPLPLTPTTPTSTSTPPRPPRRPSTAPRRPSAGSPATERPADAPSPEAPSPIRLEHAALLAAGVLALVGVRRRQRLRSAMPRHRVPTPRDEVTNTERRLRTIDAGERVLRADVACRAAARSLIGTDSQIGWVEVSPDGDVEVRLTAPATLPLPWTGEGQSWQLGAEVPDRDPRRRRPPGRPAVRGTRAARCHRRPATSARRPRSVRRARRRCPAADQADEVVTALWRRRWHRRCSPRSPTSSPCRCPRRRCWTIATPTSPVRPTRRSSWACSLVGTTAVNERSSFELRSLRTGGEMWEPAVVLLRSADDGAEVCGGRLPAAGHGLAVVVADAHRDVTSAPTRAWSGVPTDGGSRRSATSIDLMPIGVSEADLAEIGELLVDADRTLKPVDPTDEIQWADQQDSEAGSLDAEEHGGSADAAVPFEPRPHEIVVGLLGGVEVHTRTGEAGSFERSKTVELIAWLTTHRDRATRTGARTALWDLDVRDATFANVVSEARRALARLVPPPDGEEWVARTLTDQLPVHDLVVTDADLVEDRLAHARVQPPSQAIEALRPAVELVRDMPFAGTSYLWPDAEGITSNLVLLAISATAEFAAHALSLGDTDAVFWATGKGLRVLPGHEELIALRMQAHARAGDLAGVRQEWESYERVLVADAWSDGEPAPKLLALRRELLNPTTS